MKQHALRDFIVAVVLLVLTAALLIMLLATECAPNTDDVQYQNTQHRSFTNDPPQGASVEDIIIMENVVQVME